MRPLVLPLACLALVLGCSEAGDHQAGSTGLESKPGAPPLAQPRELEAPAKPSEPPSTTAEAPPPSEPSEPPPEPQLDERKQALANVGRAAFDALRNDDFEGLLALTAREDGAIAQLCPDLEMEPREQQQARFDHCRKQIDWDAVAEAQVFAGVPSGAPAPGCEAGIEDYGRLQLFLRMQDAKIWRVDFLGAVGREGNAIGIDGSISCKQVDEIPPLR